MNKSLLRKTIGLILAALLLTGILLLSGTTAAAKRHQHWRDHWRSHQPRVISWQLIDRSEPFRRSHTIRPFQTYGPFGRAYHPYFDPYGRYDRYTFYRHSIGRRRW